LAVHVIIVQLPQIIGKPLVLYGQQPEEGGFPGSLAAYQTEHDLKLTAGAESPVDGSQQEQPQGMVSEVVRVGSQKMPQAVADTLFPVPDKAVQVVPDGMVAVGVCGQISGVCYLFLACPAVGIFQIPP